MYNLIQTLRDFDALRDNDQLSERTVASIEPNYSDDSIFQRINPAIAQALQAQGVNHLYQHQAEAISKALQGNNVVLEAPTASGKTLSFAIPMMESLLREHGGHALMIYPMKAVANDQREQLVDLLERVGLQSWPYDGDTESEHRTLLKENPPNILITNPEMLQYTFLAWNEQWKEFLENLKFVVIDEMHEYRGYFGTNMSILLRRFAHHLSLIGASPQFFLSTATCANPKEHARNLTGQSFELVGVERKLSPQRHFVFIDPDIPDYQFYNIFQLRIRNAALACMALDKSVIVFCPNIRFAERCYKDAIKACEERSMDKDAIKLFKAGITAEEKSAVQKGMKNGSVRVVFSTNALELGIDVGALDGVILAGFPDTVMSAWQRIGRAGRGWDKDAFVLFYAMNNPVDKFHAANLEAFLNKPLDQIVADPTNEELIENHILSFLYESQGTISASAEDILGESFYKAVNAKKTSSPVKGYKPHRHLNLRGSGGRTWVLKHGDDEIGTISDYQRFREIYQDSIFLHSGRKYKVDSITAGSTNEIHLSIPDFEYARTDFFFLKTLNIEEIFDGSRWGNEIAIHLGKINLYEVLNSISVIDERNDHIIDKYSPQDHAQSTTSHAFWIDTSLIAQVEDEGLFAFEQLLRIGTIFTIPVDMHDTTTYCDIRDKQVCLIESYPGGIGIVKKAFDKWHDIIRTGIKVADACKCSRGCPHCIMPPRYYGSNDKLDKNKGIELAEYVIATTSGLPEERFNNGLWEE